MKVSRRYLQVPYIHTYIRTSRNQYAPHFFSNITKYSSHYPLSADTSYTFLALILLEIWHLQNFISIFSKGRNFTRGDNSKKEGEDSYKLL